MRYILEVMLLLADELPGLLFYLKINECDCLAPEISY